LKKDRGKTGTGKGFNLQNNSSLQGLNAKLFKKHLKTKIFKYLCFSSLAFCFCLLALLVLFTAKSAYKGMFLTSVKLSINTSLASKLAINNPEEQSIAFEALKQNYNLESKLTPQELSLLQKEVFAAYKDNNKLSEFIEKKYSKGDTFRGGEIWVPASAKLDRYYKESFLYKNEALMSTAYNNLIIELVNNNAIKIKPSFAIFTNTDSRYSEIAGLMAALKGTLYMIGIFFVFCVPMSIITALYLEEFAKDSFFKKITEVNITNLASIPSIIYGLLGLLVFINYMHLPRSSSIVGGLTLSLLVMPVLIVSARNSIKSVPRIIRDMAFAMGASRSRVVFSIVLPSALPGILTGIILTLARLIGETAPLLIIGMVAFIGSNPTSVLMPASAIPVQIYLWSSSPDYILINKASALILMLITFLLASNIVINIIRKRFEIKW